VSLISLRRNPTLVRTQLLQPFRHTVKASTAPCKVGLLGALPGCGSTFQLPHDRSGKAWSPPKVVNHGLVNIGRKDRIVPGAPRASKTQGVWRSHDLQRGVRAHNRHSFVDIEKSESILSTSRRSFIDILIFDFAGFGQQNGGLASLDTCSVSWSDK